MKFRSDVSGVITAFRFYKSAANTGIHKVEFVVQQRDSTGIRDGDK